MIYLIGGPRRCGKTSLAHALSKQNSVSDKLSILFLYKTDAKEILSGLRSGRNDRVIRHTKNESTFQAIADMIAGFGRYIETEAKRHQLRAINTETAFAQKIAGALAHFSS